MPRIPREFHFIFGLRPQDAPFHLVHWLCLESCRRVNRPSAIHFHCRHRPYGPWWERIAPHLVVHAVRRSPRGFEPARYAASAEGRLIAAAGYDYAHEADFMRLDILHRHGGVYADMDTLFVRPHPADWYARDCVIGEEAAAPDRRGVMRPSLCNALVLAAAGSDFIARWRDEARASFDGTWSHHSCAAAARVWARDPAAVTVLPQQAFYRHAATRAGIDALFNAHDTDAAGVYSLHLWAHLWWAQTRRDFTTFHAGRLTPSWVRRADATYAVLARRFLPADA